MKKIIVLGVILSSLLNLNACSTFGYGNSSNNVNNASLNAPQEEATTSEIANILKSTYPSNSYKNIGLNTEKPLSKQLLTKLTYAGYAVDEPSSKNILLKYYVTKLEDKKIIINLTFGDVKLGRIYTIKSNKLVALGPLNIGKYQL
jgi:hypothetical protein